ncbi:MAG: ribonuclease Y [Candidatus Saccharimonadales bacterium]
MDIFVLIALAVGVAGGFAAKTYTTQRTIGEAEKKAKEKIEEAEAKSKNMVLEAKEEAVKIAEEAKKEEKERRRELTEAEKRVNERQEALDKKLDELDKRSEALRKHEAEIEEFKKELKKIRDEQQTKLEKIAKLSQKDAKEKLMQMTERDIKEDLVGLIGKLKDDAQEKAEETAKEILVGAMERLAGDVTAEKTVTTVDLPDDMKGRVIGKEGRNIQALERVTGVDFLVDDTPGVVVLSSFDPVRRQVARLALEKLIKDGRIHPARVEEVVKKAEEDIEKEVIKAGEDAARDVGVTALPKDVIRYMGELKFRTSYGQNVLKHSVEMAHMAGMIAEEVGANVRVTKTAAFIHDLGKALTHKIEGKHHHISGQIARKYGLDEAIAHAAEAHHDDVEAKTSEALIVRAVDALSASRPGARGDSLENYVKRMKDLENVTNTFPGIEKSFAISAGRELRVFVKPMDIDDLSAIKLARDIANKIESTLQFPGTVKVNVIRETRAIEYAK